MTERQDCIDEILKNIRDRKDRKYVQDNLDELDERASADESNATAREKYFRAAKEMLQEQMLKTAVLRRNIRMDALKARDLRTYVDAAAAAKGGSYQLGVEARLTGVNTPFFDPKSRQGNQASAGAVSLGAQRDWIGGAVDDMARAGKTYPKLDGLDRIFFSRAVEDEIFLEKMELERQAKGRSANPGLTKNESALAIAKILHKWDKAKVTALNSEGAWITEHSAFGATVIHDPDKLRTAGKPKAPFYRGRTDNTMLYKGFTEADRMAWVAKTLPRIDAKKMFGSQPADKALAEMYGGLVTGDHLEMTTAPGDEPIFPNVARKVSAAREFIWKSPRDQLEYMKELGRFNPTDAWLHGMRDSANKYALLKVFGSKPKESFEDILTYAKNRTMGEPARIAFDKREGALRNRFAVVSGEADRPIPNMWSGIVNGVMAVQRLAKLGLTPFAMLQDNVTISRELAYQGINYFDRNSGLFSGYVRGAPDSEKRQVASLLHAGILGRLRGVTARFDVSDARSGTLARMENLFFKITGMTPMTENKRADAERMMAFHMGQQRGKAYADLGEGEARILQAFGIGDKEWDLLNKTDWNTIEGETYLTPDVAMKVSDDDMKAYLGGSKSIAEQAAEKVKGPEDATIEATGASPAASPVERGRQDLALKLWSYYAERGQYAVLEVGPRERAILYQGTQVGSPLNLALRIMLQFKQFPTAMITKVWGRDVYGGAGGMNQVAGLVELVVSSTLFGMLANTLNMLAKGQDPFAQMEDRPAQFVLSGFMRGGAGTIYGDFLLGEWSRFGLSATATLAGPTLGQIDRVAEVWAALTHLKDPNRTAATAVQMARNNTPFANMIYTRSAIDYLIFYRLQEYLNPGYLGRMERSMKERSGIEFWLRPTQVSR